MKNDAWLTYARLLRLPNVFTAFADIGLACAATGACFDRPLICLLTAVVSGTLYLAGMVWNDVFDRAEDARFRPFRPIPSGRVSVQKAVLLAVGLMLTAAIAVALLTWLLADGKGPHTAPIVLAALLTGAIVLYDAWLKRTKTGPISMGLCRALNVGLGLSVGDVSRWTTVQLLHLPAVVGLYIVGVTWFARQEEVQSRRGQLIAASVVMVFAGLLAVLLPLHHTEGSTLAAFPYLVVAWGFFVGLPVFDAIRHPTSKRVQTAVKRCIFGLVVFDGVMATVFVGWPGLLIILLLAPAIRLGRRVYST